MEEYKEAVVSDKREVASVSDNTRSKAQRDKEGNSHTIEQDSSMNEMSRERSSDESVNSGESDVHMDERGPRGQEILYDEAQEDNIIEPTYDSGELGDGTDREKEASTVAEEGAGTGQIESNLAIVTGHGSNDIAYESNDIEEESSEKREGETSANAIP